ncbi:MAG: glycosyltransferase family 4 protein [Candidatus Babeliales bacterium]
MKKTVLYLRTDIFNEELIAGGSVTHTTGVIEGFMHNGYEVVCASSLMHSILETLPIKALYTLKNPRIVKFLRWKINCILSNFFFTLSIASILKKHSIDYLYQRYSILNCSGILISKLKKIPLFLEYNGSELWVDNNWGKQKWFSFNTITRLIELYNIKNAHYIIVVSEVLKDELIARDVKQEKILVNPNGVNTDSYDPAKLSNERTEIRRNLHIEEKFVFGFIGTFSQWHGINILQEMIPEVIKNYTKAHFLLIGDGPLKNNLEKELKEYKKFITYTGILPSQEARAYLAACDAFLSPTQPNADGSRFFGSPTKLFEYMSMAKPIIASDLEQIKDIIYPALRVNTTSNDAKNDNLGILVEPKNTKDFIAAATMLIDRNKELSCLGFNARNKAVKEFSWDHHVKKIENFIQKRTV